MERMRQGRLLDTARGRPLIIAAKLTQVLFLLSGGSFTFRLTFRVFSFFELRLQKYRLDVI